MNREQANEIIRDLSAAFPAMEWPDRTKDLWRAELVDVAGRGTVRGPGGLPVRAVPDAGSAASRLWPGSASGASISTSPPAARPARGLS